MSEIFIQITMKNLASSQSIVFMVEAGEIELIKIRYDFQNTFQKFLVEAMKAFTGVTKIVESIGLV